jgi:hypothetical protein
MSKETTTQKNEITTEQYLETVFSMARKQLVNEFPNDKVSLAGMLNFEVEMLIIIAEYKKIKSA